jgi:uncharacterized protein
MRPLLKTVFALMVAFAALYATPNLAQTGSQLDAYRADGVIAERFDGYVELRDSNAPSEARALVKEVNAKRKALYKRRADEQNVPVKEVGKIFANKIVKTAPAGTYFRQPGGGYVQK